MAAKAPKTRVAPVLVFVEVLQNGAPVLAFERPLKGSGTLALDAEPEGPLAIPHYPLPNGKLEFLRFGQGKATLVVDHKWEGFCTSQGELRSITRGENALRRAVAMERGDYASIYHNDLRIMVKLAGKKALATAGQLAPQKGYRKPFLAHFLPSIEEKRAAIAGGLAAFVVVGGFAFGLLNRPVSRPTKLDEIAPEYMLPFVAPDHLRHGPEALQGTLDRKESVRSVMDYYQSLTAVLMGWPRFEARHIHPPTVALYHGLHEDARRVRDEKLARQKEVDHLQGMKNGVGLVAVPAVVGESMNGSMLRIIDKIDIMQQGFAHNLAAKREIIRTFPKDPEYAYEEYKNFGVKDDRIGDYLGQIRPWDRQTDEQMMYNEAESLAKRAHAKQRRIIASMSGAETLTPHGVAPIGMPDGIRFATFAYDMDFMLADEKLAQLQGSEFGTPKAKPHVKEPLIGEIEPELIERHIRQNRFQLQLCYELALRRDELAAGVMEWRWRIDSRGTISEIALVSTSIKDNKMAQCIRQKISQWRFPRPRKGAVEVSYPFEFSPDKG